MSQTAVVGFAASKEPKKSAVKHQLQTAAIAPLPAGYWQAVANRIVKWCWERLVTNLTTNGPGVCDLREVREPLLRLPTSQPF
jgi:hypothetical protein